MTDIFTSWKCHMAITSKQNIFFYGHIIQQNGQNNKETITKERWYLYKFTTELIIQKNENVQNQSEIQQWMKLTRKLMTRSKWLQQRVLRERLSPLLYSHHLNETTSKVI